MDSRRGIGQIAQGDERSLPRYRQEYVEDGAAIDLIAEPIEYTRMCWYSDVVDGDWVIDYVDKFPSLMIAAGGSGHAFKVRFLSYEDERADAFRSSCRSWAI